MPKPKLSLFKRALLAAAGFSWSDFDTNSPYFPSGGMFTRKTKSGQAIDASKALTLSAYYAGIKAPSEDLAALPLLTYRDSANGGKELAVDHPVFNLLRDRPNDEMNSANWREAIYSHSRGWGGGFTEIERTKGGQPIALWPIHPSRVRVLRESSGAKRLFYRVTEGQPGNNQDYDVMPENMLHLHGLGAVGSTGYVLSALAAEWIGTGLASEEFVSRFFQNDATLGIVLTVKGRLDSGPRSMLRDEFMNQYSSGGGAHSVAVLSEDTKAERMGIPPQEAQLIELQHFSVEQAARWLRVPLHKLAYPANQPRANLEQENRSYVLESLVPEAVRFEQECNYKLFSKAERGKYFVRHNFADLMRGDSVAQAQVHREYWTVGVLTHNDILAELNRNPYPDGNERWIPSTMKTVSQAMKPPEPPPAPAPQPPPPEQAPDQEQANMNQAILRPIFEEALTRVFTKEARALEKAVKKPKAEFQEWAGKFYSDQASYYVSAVKPAAQAYARLIWGHEAEINAVLESRAGLIMAARHVQALDNKPLDIPATVNAETDALLDALKGLSHV